MRPFRHLLSLIAAIIVAAGCFHKGYADAVFEVDNQVHSLSGDEQLIPIRFSCRLTKTSQPIIIRDFRFRTIIDGMEGDAKVAKEGKGKDCYWTDGGDNAVLNVFIPENDSGHQRPVVVEISLKKESSSNAIVWQEWEPVYHAIQCIKR